MDDDLLYHFNKILLEKREEIIELANKKKREVKKTDPNKLDRDTNTTVARIKLEQEKRLKNSAKYKKAEAEIK